MAFLACAGLAACGEDEPENNESNGQNENNENNGEENKPKKLTAPTVSPQYNVLRWRADGNPEDYVQGYKFIISYEGYEREGDSIELYYLSQSCTIKIKTVPNYMGKEAGYCESEWTTYTYTRSSSGADGKG